MKTKKISRRGVLGLMGSAVAGAMVKSSSFKKSPSAKLANNSFGRGDFIRIVVKRPAKGETLMSPEYFARLKQKPTMTSKF